MSHRVTFGGATPLLFCPVIRQKILGVNRAAGPVDDTKLHLKFVF